MNGKVIFEDKDKIVRIARAYSQVVKSAIRPLFDGKSVDELTKEFYNILPNYIYLETLWKIILSLYPFAISNITFLLTSCNDKGFIFNEF